MLLNHVLYSSGVGGARRPAMQAGRHMDIYTIGFTRRSASDFFGALRQAGIKRLLDVRLNNSSQLAAFTKRDDLPFFLREICGAEYRHELLLAPTQEMLDAYKKEKGSWADYERRFLALLAERRVEDRIDPELFAVRTVLLCSETTPEYCHRRLVCEYLAGAWGAMTAIHL
ncbi:MAG TPA: DUF488 domain-containing protein [Chloroflexota bacterium]|nr:DUF488 domain-containing protein [Chloroflexota bacterium]